jgi:hypothetical protein
MMKKIFSILVGLALVLSFSVVATPVSADQYAELAANITAPVNGTAWEAGTPFTVTANVTNNGTGYAQDVKATIGITGNAALAAGQVATRSVNATLPADNATVQVSWTVNCLGPGNVSISVTPSGIEPSKQNPIAQNLLHSDNVTVYQQPILQVTIQPLAQGGVFNVTDGFDVVANVTNISSFSATDVTLTISVDRCAGVTQGNVTRWVGNLAANATAANYIWGVNCTCDGFSRITVSPSGKVGGGAIPAAALIPAKVRASQGDFVPRNITLVAGWNLISLPLIPLDSSINGVLADILDNVISVWHYDAAAKRWYSFTPGASSDLTWMKDGEAYWINMKAAQNLTLAGTQVPKGTKVPPTYDVVAGWNMVGFKSTANNVTAADYLKGIEPVRIYYFEGGVWKLIPTPFSEFMKPGLGYWVAFTALATIYPPL